MPSLVTPLVRSLPAEQPVLAAGELLRPWHSGDAPALVEAVTAWAQALGFPRLEP